MTYFLCHPSLYCAIHIFLFLSFFSLARWVEQSYSPVQFANDQNHAKSFFFKLWSQHEILETWFVVSCLTPSTALNLLPQKYSFFLILKTFAGTFDLVKPFSGNFWRTGLLSSVMVTCPSQSRWLGFSLLISRGVPQSFSKGGGHHLCCKLATEVMSGLPVAKREQEQPLPSSKTHDWLV